MTYRGFYIPFRYHANVPIYGMDPEQDHRGNLYYCDVYAEEDFKRTFRLHSMNIVHGREVDEISHDDLGDAIEKFIDGNFLALSLHKRSLPVGIRNEDGLDEGFLRVFYYCRESRYDPYCVDQETNCRKAIENHPEWIFGGGYIDHTRVDPIPNRESAFRQMLQDCEDGFVDVVVVNSVEDFASNVTDALYFMTRLNNLHIPVYFSKNCFYSDQFSQDLLLELLDILIPTPTDRYPKF